MQEAGTAARTLAEQEFDRDKLANQLMAVLELTVQSKTTEVEKIAHSIYS